MPNISNKPLTLAAMFAAAVAAMIIFAVVPLIADIKSAGSQISGQIAEAADYDRRIVNARGFTLFNKRESRDMEKIAGVFADGRMPLELINSLENAAKSSGVEYEFLPAAAQNPKNSWPAIKIEVSVSGAVPAILQFIERLENSPYLIEIESAAIRAAVEPAARQNLPRISSDAAEARILLKIYAKVEPK
jgi:hypothetical protein